MTKLLKLALLLLFAALPAMASVTTLTPQNGGTGCNLGAGTNGQIPISDGTKFCPADPIVSYNFVNLISAQSATALVTGTAQRISTLSASGTLTVTYAGITGSPVGCTLQIKNIDNLGNSVNDGGTIAQSPANGTTTSQFTPTSTMVTADQMSATFNCATTFPSAGTISVVFTPGITVYVGNAIVLAAGTAKIGIVTTDQTTHGTSDLVAADITKIGGNAVAADSNGRQILKTYPDTTTASYRASKKFAASSTTDNAVMPGNASNTVVLTKILLTCNETTAGQINVEIIKRSTADTSGTSAAMTAVPMDSGYSAAVSAPLSYTGTGPTVGTPVGDLDNLQIGCMAAATATPNDIFIFHPDKPTLLHGTAQQVAVNVGNAALTGGNITVTFEWMETTTP